MSPFKLTPVCAAACLLLAANASVRAQSPAAPPAGGSATVSGEAQRIEVTGMRRSLRTTEEIKRDSVQVVDSINAADIGAFPDRSVAESLQRIAGVQVGRDLGETSAVIIRGLPDVSTSVNGLELFTAAGRRLAYQDLPVQSIAGIDVYKSLTADILEGGIAGSVNFRLAAPFDQRGFVASGRADVRRSQPQGSSASPKTNDPSFGGTVSNRWSTPRGEFGMLLDAFFQKDRYAFPVQWNDRPEKVWSVDAAGNATRIDNQPYLPLNPGDRLATASHVGGIYNAGDRERQSVHAAFQWKPDAATQWTSHLLSTGYKSRRETDYIFSIIGWTPRATNVVVDAVGPGCIPNNGNPICPVLSSTNPRAQFDPGRPEATDPYTATSTQAFDERTRTHLASLGVTWRGGRIRFSSDAAFSTSDFERDMVIVDQQVLDASSQTYFRGADGHGGFTAITTPTRTAALRDADAFVLRGLVQGWTETSGKQLQWRNDVELDVGNGLVRKLLGGVRLSTRHAESHSAERFNDVPAAVRPTPSAAFGSGFSRLVPGVDRLLGPFQTPDRDFLLDRTDTVRAFYNAGAGRLPEDPNRFFEQKERTLTGYLQTRLSAEFGGASVLANAGVRVVRVDRRLKGQSRVGGTVTPIDLDTSETNVLPSLSGVVSWTDRLQSHFSIGRTITRPDFADLNPALSLTPGTVNMRGFGSAGNPNLEPTESTSTDLTLEYYFRRNGYVQAAVFDRRIDGYLQRFSQVETIGGENYEVTRPQNSNKGRLNGLELGGQAFFDFLPAPWSNFGLQANYTLINGRNEVRTSLSGTDFVRGPLTNVAKKNYNLALMYQGHGITARLAGTRRGEYAEEINVQPFGLNNVVRGATYVDLSIGYAITRNVTLQFDAINLTKTNYQSYIGDPSRPRDIRYNPAAYSLGLRVSL